MGQVRIGPDRSDQDRTGEVRIDQDRPGLVRKGTGQVKMGQGWSGWVRTDLDR